MSHRLLVVEDDPSLQHLYKRTLGPGFSWKLAKNVREARRELATEALDAVVLDWNLPDGDGLSLIKEIRASEAHKHLLILMVTGRTNPDDLVQALNVGADDFMPKPVNEEILLARLNALSRRMDRPWHQKKPIVCAGLVYDPVTLKATLEGKKIDLCAKSLRLLEFFLRRPNIVHEPRIIWESIWGTCAGSWEHTLVVTLSGLRRALGPWGERIECRKGLGYILPYPVDPK